MQVDFSEIKAQVSIDRAAEILGLKLKPSNGQLRGKCPICHSDDDRAFVITPAKGAFYCFKEGKGGDMLTLVARIRGCNVREAAEWIAAGTVPENRTSTRTSTSSRNSSSQPSRGGFDPEAYARDLDPAHSALEPLGVAAETFRAWKAGYSKSGINRGRLALPVAAKDGTIVAFIGRGLADAQPVLTFPNGFHPEEHIFGADRVQEGELTLVKDPIGVLSAAEAGIGNCVCFLTEAITAAQLEMLAALMDEKRCSSVSLF